MFYKCKTIFSLVIASAVVSIPCIFNIPHCFGQGAKINSVLKIIDDTLVEATPREIWRYDCLGPLSKVAFSPDGKLLACDKGDSIAVWDWKSDILINELKLNTLIDPNSYLRSITFSPNGRYLAAGGGGDNFLGVWDLSTEKFILLSRGYYGLDSELDIPFVATVYKVEFTPDSRFLFVGARSKIRIWDILKGEDVYTFYGFIEFAISPDGTTLAAYSDKRCSIVFWDLKTKEKLGEISTDHRWGYGMCFSPNGSSLAYYTRNLIVVCDVKKMKKTGLYEKDGYVMSVEYFPCGQYLLSIINRTAFTRDAGKPWQVYADVIDANNHKILARYKAEALSTKISLQRKDLLKEYIEAATNVQLPTKTKTQKEDLIYDPKGIFWRTVLSPDGQNIAICCEGGRILLWETPEMFLNKAPHIETGM